MVWLLRLFILLVILLFGFFIGALNSDPVFVDMGIWQTTVTSGTAFVLMILIGTLMGAAAIWFGMVLPLYARLYKNKKALKNKAVSTNKNIMSTNITTVVSKDGLIK